VLFSKLLRKKDQNTAGGALLAACGLIVLTTYTWTAPTHPGVWIDVIRLPLLFSGMGMMMAGTGLLLFEQIARLYLKLKPAISVKRA
jgi:hypothetical protein